MLKSRDLMGMTPDQLDMAIDGAMESGARNASAMLAEVNARVAAYEERYGLSTAKLIAELTANEREETLDICHWLFWADVRDSVVTPRP